MTLEEFKIKYKDSLEAFQISDKQTIAAYECYLEDPLQFKEFMIAQF